MNVTASPLRYLFAAGLLGLLALHGHHMTFSQLVWGCHVATAVIALGLVIGSPAMVATGVVFHAGQGIPAYILELIVVGDNTVTSVFLHTLPIGFGIWALAGAPFPRNTLWPAWAIHLAAMPVAYFFTDPKLNVMLVHEPWPATSWLFPQLWMSWIGVSLCSLVWLTAGWWVVRKLWPERWR